MDNKQLQSDYLFDLMKGSISKEDCIRTVKEIRLNEISAYMNFFQGGLHKNIADMSEADLDEIATATKFFCRIKDAREGYIERERGGVERAFEADNEKIKLYHNHHNHG